jgi:hypothetical protein
MIFSTVDNRSNVSTVYGDNTSIIDRGDITSIIDRVDNTSIIDRVDNTHGL